MHSNSIVIYIIVIKDLYSKSARERVKNQTGNIKCNVRNASLK